MKMDKVLLPVIVFLFQALTTVAQSKYEFRGVWVATVVNIDWPNKEGLSSNEQKAEFIHLLDMHKRNGMNAVIVQVRPSADALYPSQYEPWSEYLSGKQGVPPSPYYDPLQFMIDETHKRGMEFHAWINPYRAVFDMHSSSVASNHITRTHPEWFLTYGGKKYFNPGLPEVMQYVNAVVRDIISRYDIDGLHLDDYFYPYRITGKEFPDEATYRKYGNGMDKEDWRRSNTDSIIKMIHQTVVSVKPTIRFGVSPFGVWRNKSKDPQGSDTRAGQTNYDDLYADILLWLKEGWIDYVAPQLYWEIGHHLCDYTVLLKWWGDHSYGKHVYIGHGIYRTVENPTAAWRNPYELPNEIKLLRMNNNIQGSIYFNSKVFDSNPNGWNDSLQNNYYKKPALLPPMNWIDTVAPQKPSITNFSEQRNASGHFLNIEGKASDANETETVKTIAVYVGNDMSKLNTALFAVNALDYTKKFQYSIDISQIPVEWKDCFIAVTAVDKENNESSISNVVQLIKTSAGWTIAK
jgi:uncharacterized lipoprotein YddW (UPF0748 family)